VGDAGVGKSTLISELARDVRTRHVRVVVGRALPLDDPPPFSLIQSAIEGAREDPTLKSDEDPPLGGDSMLIGFAFGLRESALPAPIGLEERLLEALGGTPGRDKISRSRVLGGISERFLEFTRHGPAVVILEDIDRADEASLVAVEFFANELKDRPLWILATCRPPAALSTIGRTRLQKFEKATLAEKVTLHPMTSAEVADYLRKYEPARQISADEVTRLHAETGGIPLLLRRLDRKVPSRGERLGELEARTPRLDEESSRLLDLAAILGPEVPFELLLGASGEEEERLAEILDKLVESGSLRENSGERYEFPEERLREETYRRLSEVRRRSLHRQAGAALEAMGNPDVARTYALARHFYLGRDGPKSIQYNRLAAGLSERALAPEAAWEHYTRALDSLRTLNSGSPDEEAELVLELARVTEELGLLGDSKGILRDFLDRPEEGQPVSPRHRAILEIFLARVLTDEGDMSAAGALASKVLGTPGLEDQLFVMIGAHRQLGQALYYEGRYPEALAQHTEEIRLARKAGNELVIARAQVWRIAALQMMGQTQPAIAEARDVTVARDRLGSVRESAMAHLFFGDILADARSTPPQRAEALEEYRAAIGFAERAKDPRRIAWALYKTAELLREGGRLDEAVEKAERARELFGLIGDKVGLSVSHKVRGQIALDKGAYDDAESALREAHRLLEGLNHILWEIDVVLRLAQLAYARGDRAGAHDLISELERLNVHVARPDLEDEFERLKQALANEDAGSR